MKTLKNSVTKKVIVCFYNLGEENLERKVAAFVIFPSPRMVLFKIHLRFKSLFLYELRVSFKKVLQLY